MDNAVVIGIDPDTSAVGIGVVDAETKELRGVKVVRNKSGRKGPGRVMDMANKCRGQISELLGELGHPDVALIVVENQTVRYSASKGVNPNNMIGLAQVAGALVCECFYETNNVAFPEPSKWKGSVPKQIHQNRILSKLHINAESVGSQSSGYARPKSPERDLDPDKVVNLHSVSKSDWKHVVDGIGLALWGADLIKKERS